jgi:hypothetical protein
MKDGATGIVHFTPPRCGSCAMVWDYQGPWPWLNYDRTFGAYRISPALRLLSCCWTTRPLAHAKLRSHLRCLSYLPRVAVPVLLLDYQGRWPWLYYSAPSVLRRRLIIPIDTSPAQTNTADDDRSRPAIRKVGCADRFTVPIPTDPPDPRRYNGPRTTVAVPSTVPAGLNVNLRLGHGRRRRLFCFRRRHHYDRRAKH